MVVLSKNCSRGTFLLGKHCRHFASTTSTQEICENETKLKTHVTSNIKSFDEVPGPKGFLGIGTLFSYMTGKYSWDKMHEGCMKKYKKYGSIVRERLLPGRDASIVFLFDPDDIAKVLNEKGPGLFPCRRSHLALKKYRDDRPDVYNTGGLLPTNGQEWYDLRSEFQKGLSSPQNVRQFLPLADEVVKEFINEQRSGFILDYLNDIERLNLELVCLMAFDIRLNAFSEEELSPHSISSRLIEAARISNSLVLPLDQGLRLWRWFKTTPYKKFHKAQRFMEDVAIDLVSQKLTYYHEESQDKTKSKSLLDSYLQNPNLNLQDIIGMACDLLLAGVDTSSYTTSYALFHLGMNPEVQAKLYEEAKLILPDIESVIDGTTMNNQVTYARAVLKETLRLNPIAIGVGRILNNDTVLSGYLIPKGTVVVTQTQVASLLEKNFENPLEFNPERWIRNKDGTKPDINPYTSLPFGHGPRSCIARRFAEQNIILFLLRLIRKFEVKWTGNPTMEYSTKLINVPDQPISVELIERKS
uniref:CSON013431 protein n=1 Tax=Culicoides sonorensis TaxID=179676 RepID=A0A336KNN7_CULSO